MMASCPIQIGHQAVLAQMKDAILPYPVGNLMEFDSMKVQASIGWGFEAACSGGSNSHHLTTKNPSCRKKPGVLEMLRPWKQSTRREAEMEE